MKNLILLTALLTGVTSWTLPVLSQENNSEQVTITQENIESLSNLVTNWNNEADLLKKSEIAVNASDARPSRFVGGERIDAAIKMLDLQKRKVSLSIKLLEELQNKAALEMGSNPLSGRQLPFSSLEKTLSEKLEKKEKKSKKE